MNRWLSSVLYFALIPVLSAADKYGLPAEEEIPKEERMPQSVKLSVDKNGDLLSNGKTRYLTGMQIGSNLISDLIKVPGTPKELEWIYDKPLDYQSAQRLGFDSLSLFNINTFVTKFNPKFWSVTHKKENFKLYARTLESKLPLYMDFTQFPWTNGILAAKGILPKEAVNAYNNSEGNHWVAYNVNHPLSRKILSAMLEEGVKLAMKSGSPIIAYELFNEPAYDDPSAYNRNLFAQFLEKRYGNIDVLNKNYGKTYASFRAVSEFKHKTDAPGLFVDWCKFMEKSFTDHVAAGMKAVREVDPQGRASVQIMGYNYYRYLPRSNVNMYEISRILNATTVPTGGGIGGSCGDAPAKHAIDTPLSLMGEGMLMRHFFRAISEGKPIVNSELYTGDTPEKAVNALWLDHMRGSNASYLFSWSKRGWEWGKFGARRLAEKYPYALLIPDAFHPEYLKCFRQAKNEILSVGEFFGSRKRGIPREVAVLLSFPTERYAGVTGNIVKNDVTTYTSALEFSHYPIDALLEEQLPEGRSARFRAIIAPGVRNIYPETAKHLLDFVRRGGILILARDTMKLDEYGHPADWNGFFDGLRTELNPAAEQSELKPGKGFRRSRLLPGTIKARAAMKIISAKGWEQLASIDGTPAVIRKGLGKGFVYLIAPEMQDYPAAAVLGGILNGHAILPALDLTDLQTGELAVNVETHLARRGNRVAVFLFNFDRYPKLVRLNTPGLAGSTACDLLGKKKLSFSGKDKSGVVLLLKPNTRALIGIGPEGSFGKYPEISVPELEKEYAKLQKEAAASHRKLSGFSYSPDLSRTTPVDLRKFCNRGFTDSVAGDGKGGWTDQGAENSLEGVPWGIQKFAGVPCEVIRFDQNENRTCIVMASKSRPGNLPVEVLGIPINNKVKALYFFHCAAWCSAGERALLYRIRYSDGTTAEHKAVVGKNIFDWWIRPGAKQIAWKNRSGKGFQVDRWTNPMPGKEVRSIDIVSPNSKVVPIIIGITAEEVNPDADNMTVFPWDFRSSGGFGNVKTMLHHSGELTVSVNEKTGDWAGINIQKKDFPETPDSPGWAKGFLVFEIKGGPDRFGNLRKGGALQLALTHRNPKTGKHVQASKKVAIRPYVDGKIIPENEFTTVRIPLARFEKSKTEQKQINSIMMQYYACGKSAGGFSLRNLRFEIPQK